MPTALQHRTVHTDPCVADRAARIRELEREIADRQRELVAIRVEQRDQDDARLLHAIALSVGDRCFSARELANHAAVDQDLAEALGSRNANRVGRRVLVRLVNRDLQGLVLLRLGKDEDGCRWQIRPSC